MPTIPRRLSTAAIAALITVPCLASAAQAAPTTDVTPAITAAGSPSASTSTSGAPSAQTTSPASSAPKPTASSTSARPTPSSSAPSASTSASATPSSSASTRAAVVVPTPKTWGLSVTQPSTHTPGVTWAHFGDLTIRGTLTPAPPVGTPVVILRNNRSFTHATTGVGGTFSVTIGNAPNAATLGYTAQLLTGATSPTVTVVNKMPTVTTVAPSTLDAVKPGAVTMTTQPAVATKLTLALLTSSWVPTAFATSSATGTGTASLTYGETVPGTYQLRGQFTAPDGTVIVGPATQTVRVAMLDAVVRATTAGDVQYSYRAGCPVGPSQLDTITMNYIGYDRRVHTGGQLVVARYDANRVVTAFAGGMAGGTPIKSMLNPDNFVTNGRADDYKMMNAGNTSAFNCRQVSGNPNATSPHSFGYAVDINDWENPYYNNVSKRWYGDVRYATYRPASVTGLLVPSTPLVVALKAQGANWYYGFDWQHFDMPH